MEDPKEAKGMVKRGVIRVVTPGTVIESNLLDEKKNNYGVSNHAYMRFNMRTGTTLYVQLSRISIPNDSYRPSQHRRCRTNFK